MNELSVIGFVFCVIVIVVAVIICKKALNDE
ncbi:hypothetical protein A5882_002181 [Enterococcus sp. 4E1_DIV0656]|jgi:hypothetical protein|nr:hypothetical protein A5882_002181 [Enterococcus sp. 4E1_DIV0656]